MMVILKEIEFCEHKNYMRHHKIKMIFAEKEDSEELYTFYSTIEVQYCTKEELENGSLSDSLIEKKKAFAEKQIGKAFEINLYKFTVRELTNDRYIAFRVSEPRDYYDLDVQIDDYFIASYMTKQDVIMGIKYSITMKGLKGLASGVLQDYSTEKITEELFFSKPIPEKPHFDIPYNKYSNLTDSYIINEVAIEDVRKGCNLAYLIEDREISHYEFDMYIQQIEDYRLRVRKAKDRNESLRKKIFFWEPKEIVEELELNSEVIALFRDCIILGKSNSNECIKADLAYMEECEKRLKKRYMGEDMVKTELREEWKEFILALGKKYKGKKVIKPVIKNEI